MSANWVLKWEFNYIEAPFLPELVTAMNLAGADGWEFCCAVQKEQIDGFAVLMKRQFPAVSDITIPR